MATTDDLHDSITDLTNEQLMERLREMRLSRRESKKPLKVKKLKQVAVPKKTTDTLLNEMSPAEMRRLEKLLGGLPND